MLVLATIALVTEARKEVQEMILNWLSCIYYPMQFQKDKKRTIWVLKDLDSEANVITLAYNKQLGLQIWKTDVEAQKINSSLLRIFEMVIAGFQVEDRLGKARFF